MGTTFQSLRVRNYRLFATGQLVKLTGVWMMFIAQDWLVLQLSDDSGTALGIVLSLQFTPMLLLSLYGGKLADRYDKRHILLIVNGIWSVVALTFAVLVASSHAHLWHVFLFAGLLGLATAIETPVRQAFVSELVGTSLLPNALALNAATFNIARIVGPAIAGVGIAAFGTGAVFVVSTVASFAALVSLSSVRTVELYRDGLLPQTDRGEARIRDGLAYVRSRSDLLLPLAMVLVIGCFGFNFNITLALLAKTTYDTGPAAFGVFSTMLAVGALSGALAASSRRSRPSAYVVLGAAIVFGALETMVGLVSAYWLVVLLLLPTGFFMIYFAQAANQRVQMGTDPLFRGRVMALYTMVFMGTTPAGGPLIGWLAELWGAPVSIWSCGLVCLFTGLAGLAVKLRASGDRIGLRVRPTPRVYVTTG